MICDNLKMVQVASLILAALGAVLFTGNARANVVTLECVLTHGETVHQLFDIDYGKSTIRVYRVDDDGALYRGDGSIQDETFTAEVTDKAIYWSMRGPTGSLNLTLGRYSGKLTKVFVFNDRNPRQTVVESCHAWTPQNRQRKF